MNTILNDANAMLEQMRRMSLEAKGVVSSEQEVKSESDFSNLLAQALHKVNDLQTTSEQMQNAYELHDPKVSLAQVEIAMQKANLSFEALLQVRNKAINAYKEIENMQV